MIYGVTINGTDTLTQWGLMLLSDLNIGTPPLKSVLIDVPARDGTINMSYALNGYPVYGNRQISFTLFKAVDDTQLNGIKTALAALCHGQEKTLALPVDNSHYYRGVFSIGNISGFNSGKIPVTVTAEPYAYKNVVSTASGTIPSGGTLSLTLSNEQMPTDVTLTTDGAITLTYDGNTYSFSSETAVLPFKLPSGGATLSISGSQGVDVSFSYQEGRI